MRGQFYVWERCSISIGFALLLAFPASVRASGTVTVCDEPSLRAALEGGGTVDFNCDGVITLTSSWTVTNATTLDASGHSITLSGNGTTRLFQIPAGSSLALTNVILTRGQSTNGGAIFNEGTLTAAVCTFFANSVTGITGVYPTGYSTDGAGGAIYNSDTASFYSCVFSNNS